MEAQTFTFGDIHFLMTALDQFIKADSTKDEDYRTCGEAAVNLLDRLAEMWKMQSDFLLFPINKDSGEPGEEIVAYANAHSISLNLQSKVVQRVLKLRILEENEEGAMSFPEADDE